ncbi:hypothetical protein [Yinghuangia seranimata]|uniref:hypothetical protein n=1 Tax=Yinghuangia seranimata TaxID=408067 RepID=UPI00248C2CE0|nr:hypothetical protein [Yinghuangia seranimata]MDI2131846.1 hypothetical protein [Yinghuangia seranimata]
MADWAMYVIVGDDGTVAMHESRFGAVGIDLDLMAGPDVVLPFVRAQSACTHWRDDVWCEAAALFDLRRRVLLMFAWEGPVTRMPHRAAAFELLRAAWPGWEVRCGHDGPADLLTYMGLDPAVVRDPDASCYVGSPVDAAELADWEGDWGGDDYLCAVTVGGRCHLLVYADDHPIALGPALLDQLADAEDHAPCDRVVGAGVHVDAARRWVGWWLLDAQAGAYDMASRWPGWTVEFWGDRYAEHVAAADGVFVPRSPDRRRALVEVRDEALKHWAERRGQQVDALVEEVRAKRRFRVRRDREVVGLTPVQAAAAAVLAAWESTRGV